MADGEGRPSNRHHTEAAELSLEAMLAEEIVRLTMASDGVRADDVRALAHVVPLIDCHQDRN